VDFFHAGFVTRFFWPMNNTRSPRQDVYEREHHESFIAAKHRTDPIRFSRRGHGDRIASLAAAETGRDE
jgi:hypothetical protein